MTKSDERFVKEIARIKEKIPEGSEVVGKQFSLKTLQDTALIIRTLSGEVEVVYL